VVADAALAAALRSRPLVVTLLAGDGPGAAAHPPRALGSAEVDLAPLLHARWRDLAQALLLRGPLLRGGVPLATCTSISFA